MSDEAKRFIAAMGQAAGARGTMAREMDTKARRDRDRLEIAMRVCAGLRGRHAVGVALSLEEEISKAAVTQADSLLKELER